MVRTVRAKVSVTIGVNLDSQLRPVAATLLAMHDQKFTSSTFLDRSGETSLVRQLPVGAPTELVNVTERNKVLGAINDARLALAWAPTSALRIGFGAHVFSGSNRITFSQVFPDSSKYVSTTQSGRMSFAGFAGSLGLEYRPSSVLGFALSGRKGGDLRAQSGDTAIGSGRLPDHYSASATYEGICW